MKHSMRPVRQQVYAVLLICREQQWDEVCEQIPGVRPGISQGREFLSRTYERRRVVFLRSGVGPIAAAASTQFAIDHWSPRVLMTTPSFDGEAEAIREVGEINGAVLLPDPLEADALTDVLPAAFVCGDELLLQNRTR